MATSISDHTDGVTRPDDLAPTGVPFGIHGFPRAGVGRAVAHHGEIMQGPFDRRHGHKPAFVTLPCASFGSRADFVPDASLAAVEVSPCWKTKSRRAAEVLLTEFGLPLGGTLHIDSPILPRKGFGSSTSDVVATMRAVADAYRLRVPAATVARLAVVAEEASDALMFDEVVVFAGRSGYALEVLGPSLPPAVIVGVDLDPLGPGIDTLDLATPAPDGRRIDRYEVLLAACRHAIAHGDIRLLGRVASTSAALNQDWVALPRFSEFALIGDRAGAVGVQIAHTGTISGLIFDAADPELGARVDRAIAEIDRLGFGESWVFRC